MKIKHLCLIFPAVWNENFHFPASRIRIPRLLQQRATRKFTPAFPPRQQRGESSHLPQLPATVCAATPRSKAGTRTFWGVEGLIKPPYDKASSLYSSVASRSPSSPHCVCWNATGFSSRWSGSSLMLTTSTLPLAFFNLLIWRATQKCNLEHSIQD